MKTKVKLTTELAQAIENCYDVFSGYTLEDEILDVCTECCMDADLEREMHTLPLREITTKHFYEYNDSAKSFVQPTAEIKYLLPRMLELIAYGEEVHHSLPLYLNRVGNCPKDTFTPQEWQSIEGYADAFFRMILSRFPWEKDTNHILEHVFDYLLMLHIGGLSIQRFLDIWCKCSTPQATLNYVESSFFDFWKTGGINCPFTEDRSEFKQLMTDWFLDQENRQLFALRITALDLDSIPKFKKWSCGYQLKGKQVVQLTFNQLLNKN